MNRNSHLQRTLLADLCTSHYSGHASFQSRGVLRMITLAEHRVHEIPASTHSKKHTSNFNLGKISVPQLSQLYGDPHGRLNLWTGKEE